MKKYTRTVIISATSLVFALAIALAVALPLMYGNAYMTAVQTTAQDCEQKVYVYDNNYDLVDTLEWQGSVSGAELKNIDENNSVTHAHHVKNKFVAPYGGMQNEIIEFGDHERLDSISLAEYGTLKFVFFNLDPMDENFDADRESVISRFGYNNSSSVNIDLFLPVCFDAATVYYKDQYVCTVGDMGQYDPTEYIDKYMTSSFVPNVVDLSPQHIDISFAVSKNTIEPNRLDSARIVTVHYRAKNGLNFSSALPHVGKRETLRKAASTATTTHTALLAISAAVFVAFAAMTMLKRSKDKIPAIVALGGTVLLIISQLIIFSDNAVIGYALSVTAISVIMCAPFLCRPPKNGIVQKAYYATVGLVAVDLAIGCILPYSVAAAATKLFLKISATVITALAALLVVAQYAIAAHGQKLYNTTVLTAICGSTALAKAWTVISPNIIHPCVIIAFYSVAFALWLIGYEFFRTEKREAMLMSNLQKEVDIQTATLKNAIADREKMLSFVSHDMRKSALGINSLITDLKGLEPVDDVVNIANKIENKNDTMLRTMSEILQYAKRNYSDEPFTAVGVTELFEELKRQLQDDCEANGITLTTSTKNILCHAQKNTLLSVLFNLVFNAIEHADCTQIKVAATAHGDNVKIDITDNGMGVETDQNLFSPFTAGDDDSETNSGLGLFIVKSQTEDMGGSISYSTHQGGSTFTVTLLRTY